MGVPTYGRTWTLETDKNFGLYAPARGPGIAGTYTREKGFLAYYEICEKKWSGHIQNKQGVMGPFAYNDYQWVSYDDENMMKIKGNYIKALGLGGAMVWALDLDDHKNACHRGRYPLLTALNKSLRGSNSERIENSSDGDYNYDKLKKPTNYFKYFNPYMY